MPLLPRSGLHLARGPRESACIPPQGAEHQAASCLVLSHPLDPVVDGRPSLTSCRCAEIVRAEYTGSFRNRTICALTNAPLGPREIAWPISTMKPQKPQG